MMKPYPKIQSITRLFKVLLRGKDLVLTFRCGVKNGKRGVSVYTIPYFGYGNERYDIVVDDDEEAITAGELARLYEWLGEAQGEDREWVTVRNWVGGYMTKIWMGTLSEMIFAIRKLMEADGDEERESAKELGESALRAVGIDVPVEVYEVADGGGDWREKKIGPYAMYVGSEEEEKAGGEDRSGLEGLDVLEYLLERGPGRGAREAVRLRRVFGYDEMGQWIEKWGIELGGRQLSKVAGDAGEYYFEEPDIKRGTSEYRERYRFESAQEAFDFWNLVKDRVHRYWAGREIE